ncbi:MAG: phosphoribosylaminoimidazolecarboxamide formyltransferase [Candidatus Puniceispirillum sp.]|nr:phosphoribosylaminoimidazolecarboxamide formyltransferase [Candidatus Puniceispirillum sp.]
MNPPYPAATDAAVSDWEDQMNDKNTQGDKHRLAEIDRRLDNLQAKREEKDPPGRSALPKGMAAIMGRVATELVAGVMVGAFTGWALDRWLDTSPLFMLVMFFMGAIAGMLNVWRIFTGRGLAAGYFDEHKNSSDKDD